MKLTKGEFKLMIKECIRELVGEGAFNQVLTESLPNNRDGAEQSHRRTEQSINPHLSNLVQQAAKMVTSARPQQADVPDPVSGGGLENPRQLSRPRNHRLGRSYGRCAPL